jgi:hypothetical protein
MWVVAAYGALFVPRRGLPEPQRVGGRSFRASTISDPLHTGRRCWLRALSGPHWCGSWVPPSWLWLGTRLLCHRCSPQSATIFRLKSARPDSPGKPPCDASRRWWLPPLGGALIMAMGLAAGVRVGLVVTIGCCLAAAPLVASVYKEGPTRPHEVSNVRLVWRSFDERLRRLLVADILARWAEGIPRVFVVIYCIEHLHLSAALFGWLITVQRTTNLIAYFPSIGLGDRLNRRPFLLATLARFAWFPLVLAERRWLLGYRLGVRHGGYVGSRRAGKKGPHRRPRSGEPLGTCVRALLPTPQPGSGSRSVTRRTAVAVGRPPVRLLCRVCLPRNRVDLLRSSSARWHAGGQSKRARRAGLSPCSSPITSSRNYDQFRPFRRSNDLPIVLKNRYRRACQRCECCPYRAASDLDRRRCIPT